MPSPFTSWTSTGTLAEPRLKSGCHIQPFTSQVFSGFSSQPPEKIRSGRPSPFNVRIACGLLGFAAIFYTATLGFGPFDPYAPGYQPLPMLAAVAALGLLLWWRGQYAWLTILAIDLAGYASGLFANLWDALIDPLLVLLALIVAIYAGIKRWRRRA